MNTMLNQHKVGVALGSLMGTLHAIWSLLIAVGWAKPLMDLIYGLHFLNNPFVMREFNVGTAVALVLVTSLIGYGIGRLFGYFWNRAQK